MEPPRRRVAIAMATHAPDPRLLERQIQSFRSQTHDRWVCYVSDDASDPTAYAHLPRLVSGDRRFRLSRSDRHLGFYRNFERALGMIDDEPAAVALADQDDWWRADKLERLLDALAGPTTLVYSDVRIVDASGEVVASTYWSRRKPNHDDLAQLLVANSVSGTASLVRSDVVALALPFPEPTPTSFHDHWLAVLARSLGPIAFVGEPLVDYTQHAGNVIGQAVRDGSHGRFVGSVALRGRGVVRRQLERLDRIHDEDVRRISRMADEALRRGGNQVPAAEVRVLRRFASLDTSLASLAALGARAARTVVDESSTMGGERRLAAAVLRHRLRGGRS